MATGRFSRPSQHDIDALFRRSISGRSVEIASAIFQVIDSDGCGSISSLEFSRFCADIGQTPNAQTVADLLFHILDKDRNGWVERGDLEQILHAEQICISHVVDEVIALSRDQSRISVDDFRKDLMAEPQVIEYVCKTLRNFLESSEELSARRTASPWRTDPTRPFLSYIVKPRWFVLLGTLLVLVGRFIHFSFEVPDASAALKVAKAAGFGLLVGFVVLYLLMVPMLSWYLPAPLMIRYAHDFRPGLHASIGVVLFVVSVVHTTSHFFAVGTDSLVGSFFCRRTTFTGLALQLIQLMITVTATRRCECKSSYRTFMKTHLLHWLNIPLLVGHVPARLYVLGLAFAVVLLHEFRRWRTTKACSLKNSCFRLSHEHSGIAIPISCTDVMRPIPGSFYRICIPAISSIEWHPFSLCSSDLSSSAEFIIRHNGRWTNSLGKLVASESFNGNVYVQGPVIAPAVQAVNEACPMLIAAGVGITPFFSILHWWCLKSVVEEVEMKRDRAFHAEREQFNDVKHRNLRLIWIVRDFALVDYFVTYLGVLLGMLNEPTEGKATNINITIFLTGFSVDSLHAMVANALMLLHLCRLSAKCRHSLDIRLGRPDLLQEILSCKATAVFFCGGDALAAQLKSNCRRANVPFHKDAFQNTIFSRWSSRRKPMSRDIRAVAKELAPPLIRCIHNPNASTPVSLSNKPVSVEQQGQSNADISGCQPEEDVGVFSI
eukprot:TRINITY_DN3545_c0_g1_i8.p1 TRINITY_DN3545_c0_g1~~TRINITY_DN3545_c0_g1_i8.p1  ORF type:complete len:719 (-),score=51.02 TRINITY_DN3545_c0_g1_i8:20-2176(-)